MTHVNVCCAAIDCIPPAVLEHGSISGDRSFFDSPVEVIFTCKKGYTNSQKPGEQPEKGTVFGPIPSTSSCNCKTGIYDAPTCKAISCGPITDLLPDGAREQF